MFHFRKKTESVCSFVEAVDHEYFADFLAITLFIF